MSLKSAICSMTPARHGRSLILVYHSIGSSSPAAIATDAFARQMEMLGRSYQVVSISDLIEGLSNGRTGMAAVTFDDGYRDTYDHVLPVMSRMEFPFTVFVATGFIEGGRCDFSCEYAMVPPLTWSQLREMAGYGVTIGCHTHEHGRWSTQSSAKIRQELTISSRLIEDHVGRAPTMFAYPHGQPADVDARGAVLLPECGFSMGFTTLHTTITACPDPFRIPRLSVNADDTDAGFMQHLRGQRDVLAAVERAKSLLAGA